MAENINIAIIGTGAGFPIELTQLKDELGNPVLVPDKDGNMVNSVSWRPQVGDPRLIQQNIIAILNTPLGFNFRREYFGSRINEVIEEPNTQVSEFLIRDYITQALAEWEHRVIVQEITSINIPNGINIQMVLAIEELNNTVNLDLNFNTLNNTIHVN